MKSSKRNKKAAMKSSKPNKDSSSSSSSSTIAVKKSAPEFSEHSLLHPAESAMKSNDTSSSNTKIAVKKSAPRYPRKSSAFSVYLEEFFKQKPKNEPVCDTRERFSHCWGSLSDADKAPYIEEANRRNIVYENNRDSYNKWHSIWESMSESEKEPFFVKASVPYAAKVAGFAGLKKFMEAKNWDDHKEFDMFTFFIFWEESESKESEESEAKESEKSEAKDVLAQFCIFCESFVEEYKKKHPEDQRLANLNVTDENWWNSAPEDVLQKAMDAWEKMPDYDRAPYALQAEQRRNEALHGRYALAIYRNEYKKKNLADVDDLVSACDNAWEAMGAEEKAQYFAMAKVVLDGQKMKQQI